MNVKQFESVSPGAHLNAVSLVFFRISRKYEQNNICQISVIEKDSKQCKCIIEAVIVDGITLFVLSTNECLMELTV